MKKIFAILITFIGLTLPTFALDLSDPTSYMQLSNTSPEVQAYNLVLAKKILKNFDMPNTDEHLATLILFKIDTDGNLIDYEITQSSGNTDYDNKVINAIKDSAPYPKPTFKEATEVGVLLNMDLSMLKLIKMLSQQFDYDLETLNPPQTIQPTQTIDTPKNEQETIPNPQKPTGMKFINPDELENIEF